MRKYQIVCDRCGKHEDVPKPYISASVPIFNKDIGVFTVEEAYPSGWYSLINDEEKELTFCSVECVGLYIEFEHKEKSNFHKWIRSFRRCKQKTV